MGKATLARQRAIGAIGIGRIMRLEEVGLMILYQIDYVRLKERIGELERENKLLHAAARDDGVGVPLHELREAVRG